MTRARGYITEWKPTAITLARIDDAKSVLAEYEAYKPLTVRQVFYRLVAQQKTDKSERAYKSLCDILTKARRSGRIAFEDLRDDRLYTSSVSSIEREQDFWREVETYADRLVLDRLSTQSKHLVVWCEARGMVPQLETVASEYSVRVLCSGGFDSVSSKYAVAQSFGDKDVVVLHIGDRDPSGEHIYKSLADDLSAFARGHVSLTRLAVTTEQIDGLGLPTAPPKRTDNRSFDGVTCQAEAIAPDVLADILKNAIRETIDLDEFDRCLREEVRVRKSVGMKLARVGAFL
ncbi:MAG: hypothetical protein NXH85_18610 [Pseudomonadaceae bacterium]|nr:hypothetical protein [Pseudomonadaceae bacterium]